jgi:hypothetical protein
MVSATWQRVYGMAFADLYPAYVRKAEAKGRTRAEVDAVLRWLTGYGDEGLAAAMAARTSVEDFFANAPAMNPARSLVTGTICGERVETIAEQPKRDIRILDKMIGELAKGKAMEKVLRSS